MELTVIGYWGGYPAENGVTSAYLIEKDGFNLVIDLGSGALSKLHKYIDVAQIDAVLLSHYHHDYVADLGVLQYARLVKSYVTDRKSTRLNSSHVAISYAVFCLKNKRSDKDRFIRNPVF